MEEPNIRLEVENDLKNMFKDLQKISAGFKKHVAPEIRKNPEIDQPILEEDPNLDVESINKFLESYNFEKIELDLSKIQQDNMEIEPPQMDQIMVEPKLSDEEYAAKIEELLKSMPPSNLPK